MGSRNELWSLYAVGRFMCKIDPLLTQMNNNEQKLILSQKRVTHSYPNTTHDEAKYHYLKPPLITIEFISWTKKNWPWKTTKYIHTLSIYNEIWIFKKVCTENDAKQKYLFKLKNLESCLLNLFFEIFWCAWVI